jgi:hypothetical protein
MSYTAVDITTQRQQSFTSKNNLYYITLHLIQSKLSESKMCDCQMDEHSEEVTVFIHKTLGMVSLATLVIHNDQLHSFSDHADLQIND